MEISINLENLCKLDADANRTKPSITTLAYLLTRAYEGTHADYAQEYSKQRDKFVKEHLAMLPPDYEDK